MNSAPSIAMVACDPQHDIRAFQISIPPTDVREMYHKVKHTRQLPQSVQSATWTEADAANINGSFLRDVQLFWQDEYSWLEEEARLNQMPMYTTNIEVANFDDISTHFVHGRTTRSDARPLLFLHGWPGSFIEINKGLSMLLEAGFDVVAPSHAGFGFSSYPDKRGFRLVQHAEMVHKLMLKLGYSKYYVQGGDWGAHIGRVVALRYPEYVLGLHLNNIGGMSGEAARLTQQSAYTEFEKGQIAANKEFLENGHAYAQMQHDQPLALAVGLSDSPMALFAYMAAKILLWSDSYPGNPDGYKFSKKELITWVLINYFSTCGPLGGFAIYRNYEDGDLFPKDDDGKDRLFINIKTGISAFKYEPEMVPHSWAETIANVVWYKEHDSGGHFPMYEQPAVLVRDFVDFVDMLDVKT